MGSEVNAAKVSDVALDHPSIRGTVKNMTRNGDSVDRISQVVGIPPEAVKQVQRDTKNSG